MGSWQRPSPAPTLLHATFAVVVLDRSQHPVPGALVILSLGLDGSTNNDGYVAFTIEQRRPFSFSVHHPTYEDFVDADSFALTGIAANTEVTASLSLIAVATLPRLIINGKFFGLDGGARWTGIECSDFNLLNRSEAGEDIEQILAQRRDVGFNLLRVWGSFNVAGIGRLIPGERPALYEHIPVFLEKAAHYDLYVELTGFAGPYLTIFRDDAAKVEHWNRLKAVSGHTNLLLELVNEWNHPANKDLPFDRLLQPEDAISCHGSGIADALSLQPNWSYGAYHTNGLSEWQRKVGHNAMELADRFKIPWISNENTRFDNDRNVMHAYDAAAGAALLCAGACCHTPRGKTSELWDGDELEWAKAWVKGAQSVPLEFQIGAYHHRMDLERPGIVRAYDRRLPDGRTHIVFIRA